MAGPRIPIPNWRHRGGTRPEWAIEPGPGQESVWDYPRPPRIALESREVVVRVGAFELARSNASVRILETASPPTFYLPPDDVETETLHPVDGPSACEWKGLARYFEFRRDDDRVERIAWAYLDPYPEFDSIRGYFAFYPARAECFVDGERVRPQPGQFYGGWMTDEIVGPVKGEPGSESW